MSAAVQPIASREAEPWLLEKHYAKRVPQVSYAFGLYIENRMRGVITFGVPANKNLNLIAGQPAIELNRLCVDDDAPRNSSSFLVARSLKLIPSPMCVISYADCGQGHVGYVYQATNWLYTGMGAGDTEFEKDGKRSHRKALFRIYGTGSRSSAEANGYVAVPVPAKHRYVYFIGSKRERREMSAALPWARLPYPKGETSRYDAGAPVSSQPILFAADTNSRPTRTVKKAAPKAIAPANDNAPQADLFANAA